MVHGAMNSGKTTRIIQLAYNYDEQGMNAVLMKPKIDTKGNDYVVSRIGAKKNKMLKQYKKKLYTFSNSEGYMSLMFNEDIERNALIEGYFKAGVKEGIEQGVISNQNKIIMSMHNEKIPIELISKCVGLKEKEVRAIIDKNN